MPNADPADSAKPDDGSALFSDPDTAFLQRHLSASDRDQLRQQMAAGADRTKLTEEEVVDGALYVGATIDRSRALQSVWRLVKDYPIVSIMTALIIGMMLYPWLAPEEAPLKDAIVMFWKTMVGNLYW